MSEFPWAAYAELADANHTLWTYWAKQVARALRGDAEAQRRVKEWEAHLARLDAEEESE